jgi:uncharacterized repeat protein (TIGR01451 family)
VHVSVGGNKPNSWVVTRVQLPDGTLAKPYVRQSYDIPESLEVADVTGDGRGDLVVLHGGWNEMGVYDSTPGTNPAETLYAIPYASHYGVKGLAIGDVSGDGRADVADADYNNGLVLLRGAGAGTDTTAPHTSITTGPTGTTNRSRTATFGFTADETATFECSLDSAAWAPCASPTTYDGLSAGQHTFMVRATDTAGNTEPQPSRTSFSVDGPDTTITTGPTGTVRSTSASFAFSGSPAAASFECSMDNAAWQTCGPQVTYTGLATATSHTFRVRAVSSDGLVDSSPASRTFTVDATVDVAVTLGASSPVKHGGTLTYTGQVSNVGPNAASDVVFAQGLPSGVTVASVTATSGSPTSGTATCTTSGSPATVRCPLGSMNPGMTWTVTIKATVNAQKGQLASTAVVTTSSWDLSSGNDSASASTTVNGNGK